MKNAKITIEITESENGQLAKDLENSIYKENCSVPNSYQNKEDF